MQDGGGPEGGPPYTDDKHSQANDRQTDKTMQTWPRENLLRIGATNAANRAPSPFNS